MNNNMENKKFFLYARKSTDVEDKQVLSIDAQLTELREYAKRENIEISAEYIEKQSAKVPGRPIFNKLLNDIEKFGGSILAWHPDRLARNSVDGGRVIYLLDTGKLASLKFQTFWRSPALPLEPERESPKPKRLLSSPIHSTSDYSNMVVKSTKESTSQSFQRNFLMKHRKC